MKLWFILSVLVGHVLSDPEDLYLACLVFKPEHECLKILEGGFPEISGSSASAASSSGSGTASAAASGNAASSASASATGLGGSASAAVAAAVTTSGRSASASSSATGSAQRGFSFNPLTGNTQSITIPEWFGGFRGSPSISSSTSSNNNDVSRIIQSIFPDGSATTAASSSVSGSSLLQSPTQNIIHRPSLHHADPCSHIHPALRGSCYRGSHRPSRRPPPRRRHFQFPQTPLELASSPGPEFPSSLDNNHLLFPL